MVWAGGKRSVPGIGDQEQTENLIEKKKNRDSLQGGEC